MPDQAGVLGANKVRGAEVDNGIGAKPWEYKSMDVPQQ
jgi:hypothetical protein